jgi:hypothetical protein
MNKILAAILAAGLATQAYAQPPAAQAAQPAQQNQNVECTNANVTANQPFCWQKNQQQKVCSNGAKRAADGNCLVPLPGSDGATAAASGAPNGAVIAGVVVGVIAIAALAGGGGGGGGSNGTTGTH